MKQPISVILGSTGQDGSFLAEKLLKLGHTVICGYRKSSNDNTQNLKHILSSNEYKGRVVLREFDLSDASSIYRIIAEYQPDWLFNEADQDHVGWSYKLPSYSIQVTTEAVTTICEAISLCSPGTKLFLPVTSNIFGNVHSGEVNENSSPAPISPYGISKTAVLHLSRYYRETHNLKIITGILFNHESYKRSEHYLTKKLANAVAKIHLGIENEVSFGDLDTYVDWGCASEFTDYFCKLMNSDFIGDIVIGTGKLTKVEDLVDAAFRYKNLNVRNHVKQDPRFMRPIKMSPIYASTEKMQSVIGETLQRSAVDVIIEMIDHEVELLRH